MIAQVVADRRAVAQKHVGDFDDLQGLCLPERMHVNFVLISFARLLRQFIDQTVLFVRSQGNRQDLFEMFDFFRARECGAKFLELFFGCFFFTLRFTGWGRQLELFPILTDPRP